MRNRFDQQLELLNKQLIYMGELCEEAIGKATTALKEGSMEQAEKVRIADEEIDQAEIDIERLCLSPQCGFASCEIGNKLTEDEQWAKLKLVKEIAEEVWK